ncbi:protein-disulfide reductase DsbD family protein, partial [Phenylobacterium sp.]|uniref:protein-disulfide reductase DsbD family protein n=1 Tax=Phenylobacterium sp. TaxID=1871053 RepID=UPI0035B201B7
GFAAPFALAPFVPGLLTRLPRPGPWMDVFRKALAFPMYGTAAWLAWVLAVQAGNLALARILAAAVVVALAAWLIGAGQRRRAAGRGAAPVLLAGGLLALVAAAGAVWPNYAEPAMEPASTGEAQAAVPYEAWSPEKVAAAQAAGKPVFINFTAAWCVTCQVNEKVALSRQGVADAFKQTGAVYLKGDWTRKDAVIEAELARHGRAGVPLYLVYGAKGGEAVVLPQILTEGLIVRALKDAQAR